MKIILWPLHYLPMIGGAEVQVHSLALALQKLGHQVIAIANHPIDSFVEENYEEIKVFRFPFVSALTECNLPKIKKIFHKLSQICAEFSPDIVNTHALVNQINFYQNRAIKTALCATTHGGILEADHFQKAECVKLCTKADILSAPAKNFLNILNLQRDVRIIPNGLPPASTPTQIFPKHPIIAMVGRFSPEKGFDTAIYALKYLLPKHPNIKLFLIGDGPELPFLSQLIDSLNLNRAIEKVGVVPPTQVHHFIDRAQLVFIPSTHECLNLVALEAAMRQRPVIASDIAGLKEIVEHGVTGLLIEPRNPHILAKQADRLLSNPSLAQWMGQNGFEKISRQFSFERTVQSYLKMYDDARQAK